MTRKAAQGSTPAISNADLARLNLIGESAAFSETVALICRLATCDATTLIEGETGTGKEVAARAVHYLSRRSDYPFIPIHCGALPDTLLEAELFGHERGAFTDAKERRSGLVAEADGGTLFLDEVEAMTPRAQVVLLRFIQDQKYRAVGGRTLCSANVRIIAATNAELFDLVERGLFRQDLWFRLRVLDLPIPPLRDRPGDAVILARHFIRRFSETYAKTERRLHQDTIAWLDHYPWPGNVRELESLMLREFLLRDDDEITLRGIRPQRLTPVPSPLPLDLPPTAPPPGRVPTEPARFEADFKRAKATALAEFERQYLECLLAKTHGNISHAARLAHKERSALNKLVRKHGLFCDHFRGEQLEP